MLNQSRISAALLAGLALFGLSKAASATDWDDAYEYVSVAPGGTTNANKQTAVNAYITNILGGTAGNADDLHSLKSCGQNVHFVRTYAGHGAALTALGHALGLSAPGQTALTHLALTFGVSATATANAGGHINISLGEICSLHNEIKFALFHEIGHAVWYALAKDHAADVAKIDTHLAGLHEANVNRQMEYFADAVATKFLKTAGLGKAAVEAASATMFASEAEDKDHPSGPNRILHIAAVY